LCPKKIRYKYLLINKLKQKTMGRTNYTLRSIKAAGVLLIVLFILDSISVFSQGAAVNTSGANADPSAILDVSSTQKGLLIPRMTTSERNLIVLPAEGLQIFNTDNKCFEFYAYGAWQQGKCAVCPVPAAAGNISGNTTVCSGNNALSYNVPLITNATSYIWDYTGSGVTVNGTGNLVAIDFAVNATSGILTVKGYNNTCGNGVSSAGFNINVEYPPTAPSTASHTAAKTEIVWNWNSVAGASGYKYHTANDYANATDNGTSTTFTQSGLSCETSYTLYVWAYNTCSISPVNAMSNITSPCYDCGTETESFTYIGSQVTYGTVKGAYNNNQYCWMDRNLGATAVATAYDHSAAYGDLFQWGRLDDGHQVRSPLSLTTATQSSLTSPGHSKFIYGFSNWYNGSNPDNLWQGVSGINNPCPTGWRLPSYTEFENERSTWAANGGNNYYGAITSPLKMPAAGYRAYNYGALTNVGSNGSYWTSGVGGTFARVLAFDSNNAYLGFNDRTTGMSIRCIKDY